MLHLPIICIVCAVSALNEAFTERKNNESNTFCQFDGGGGDQNVENVTSPNIYNVAVRNSSDRAEQTITNKTNSFFYDYIINQYQDKNSTCSIMESIPLGKKFCSNVISLVRKKRNYIDILPKFAAKTLRPPLDKQLCLHCNTPTPPSKKKRRKQKQCTWGLKRNEKRLLFCLKKCKRGKIKNSLKGRKRHLDRLKVDDDLDLNKRIEKLVKEIALENQRKENSKAKATSVFEDMKQNEEGSDYNNDEIPRKQVDSFSFFDHIKRIFGFSKDFFNNKLTSNDELIVKDDLSDKAAHSYDDLKTIRKTTRYKRNPEANHIRYGCRCGPASVHVKSLNGIFSPQIRNRKRYYASFRKNRNPRKSHRKLRRITLCPKNRKKCKDRDHPMRIRLGLPREPKKKRGEQTAKSEIESTTGNEITTESNSQHFATFATNAGELTTGSDSLEKVFSGKESETTFPLVTTTEKMEITTGNGNETDDVKDDQTLEKPLLGKDFKSEEFGNQMLYSDNNQMPDSPISHKSSDKYKYELKRKYLSPERYLKIRHALRAYLVHNNILPIKKRNAKRKKKSCEENARPYKCWRSAPLLCLPYIKKCEEDQIKYLIRVLQGMLGKPFPQKVGIFEKTKFKPHLRRPEYSICQIEDGEEFECLTKPTPHQTVPPPMNNCPPCPPPVPPVNPCPPCPTTLNPCPLTEPPPCPCEGQNNQQWDYNPIQTGPPFTFPAMEGSTTACNYDDFTTPAPAYPCPNIPVIPPPALPTPVSSTPVNTPPSTPPTPSSPASYSPSVKPVITSPINPPVPATPSNPVNFSLTNFPLPFKLNGIQLQAAQQTTLSNLRQPAAHAKYYSLESDNPTLHEKEYMPIPNLNLEPQLEIKNASPKPLRRETTTTTANLSNNPPNDSEEQPHSGKGKSFTPDTQYMLPNIEQPPEWSFTTIPVPTESVPQNKEETNIYKTRRKQEYYFEPKMGRKKTRQHPIDQKQNFLRNIHHENKRRLEGNKGYLREPLLDEDQINSPLNYEFLQNRLFRMKHQGNSRKESLRTKPPLDYEYLDFPPPTEENNYPRTRKHNIERKKSGKTPLLNLQRKYERRNKRINPKRQKRNDDYYYEKFENYNEYLDPGYEEVNPKKADSKIFDMAPSDVVTPPAYEMFSELAKAVTATEPTTITNITNIATITTITTTSNTTTATIRTQKKSVKITNKPLLRGTSKSLIKSNPVLNNQTRKSFQNVRQPENSTQQFFSSSTTGTISPEVDVDCGPEEGNNSTESSEDLEKKSRKTNFFLFKTTSQNKPTEDGSDPEFGPTEPNSKLYIRENKALQESQEEGLMPTTLKTASIAKGQKKLATKPSPKVYSKVYPDSLCNEEITTETTAITKTTTAKNPRAKTTPLISSSSPADLKLQMLAVCEGYLEVVKLIKAQNRSLGEELDMTLARYCESVISQSFNSQSDKPKINEPSLHWSSNSGENPLKNTELRMGENSELYERQVGIVAIDNSDNDKRDYAELNETATGKMSESERKERRKIVSSFASREKKQNNQQTNEDADEDGLLKKGMSKEQIDLIKLLNKRKKALMSWLLNTKDPVKSGEGRETEYFDDGDFVDTGPDLSQYSGTIKPKRIKNSSGKGEKNSTFVNESIFPVYAKQYGYESGGELREIEVLWRRVNEKTHEKKIFKNVSVLALLLTSTYGPDIHPEDTELVGSNGYENEDLSEIQLKSEGKIGFLANDASDTNITTIENSNNMATDRTTTIETSKEINSTEKNTTVTFISKPDPSTIVGTPPKENNKTHNIILANNTRKTTHRFGVAKDFFQEYSIEFLDYAVYILPVMFTILFLFCCLCCAVHILNTRKKHKKKKKKKERATSTDETTETTEESEVEAKKRKRESKRRRKSEDGDEMKKRNKKFWNVLKIHPSKNDAEENPTEHKKKFLKFLKGKKEEEKNEPDSGESKPPETEDQYKKRGKSIQEEKTDEAAERRELIALLEELKKIETENSGEKKEVKSVQVQYMTQEEENSIFRRSDFSYPYEKNVFGLPKGYSFCSKEFPFRETLAARNCELYEDVNELTELLPCEGRHDLLRRSNFNMNHEDRCECFLKVCRDSGVNRIEPFVGKNESENRRFVFNKYRGISTEPSEDLLGVTQKNVGIEKTKNAAFLQEMENFKLQLNKKKHVRLKDDGVLCKL